MANAEPSQDATALLDALLERAVGEGSTDIHFAPLPDGCVVRCRIDGILRDIQSIEPSVFPRLVSRIKVLAEIDIAEKRRPQDGRIARTIAGRPVDFRISVLPSLHGESVVLRVLDRSSGLRSLDHIGLTPREARDLRSLLSQSHGMIVVTGPTGAGKTTTLYAALAAIAGPERNLITIEDPIEYEISRVVQTAVQPRLGVTFAGLLRGILRHDPDVILVGEVRDPETAEVAVRAALTGHLVLTSLHTQRAAGAVSVLLNLGVKPYALAPSLRGVVAQQLLREICSGCRTRYEYGDQLLADPDIAGLVPEGEKPSFSIGLGCERCFGSGYRGRRGIFELLLAGESIQGRILRSAPADEIERAAVEEGMATLRRNGFRLVLEGATTVEEVIRAIHFE